MGSCQLLTKIPPLLLHVNDSHLKKFRQPLNIAIISFDVVKKLIETSILTLLDFEGFQVNCNALCGHRDCTKS